MDDRIGIAEDEVQTYSQHWCIQRGLPRAMTLNAYVEVGVLREGDLEERWVRSIIQQMLGDVFAIKICTDLQKTGE